MNITKALADQNRVRIIAALKQGELCVCQVIELLELAPSTVSKHLSILRNARLIESRKEGRWMYYRLADEYSPETVKEALAWLFRSVEDETQIKKDSAKLEAILKMELECCAQGRLGLPMAPAFEPTLDPCPDSKINL